MASSSTSPFSKGRIVSTLTTVQHTSALVFGSFLIVHLAAPVVAVVAPRGESLELATKTMILGRVYYQNVLTEPLIVYASISVHIASSLVKKALQLERVHKRRREAKSESSIEGYFIGDPQDDMSDKTSTRAATSWPTISIHTISGLILIPALSIHAYLNRIAPSSAANPINELSPSELDFSYVAFGFLTNHKVWRYITWGLYTFLLGAGAVHVVGGADLIAKRMKARKSMKDIKKQGSIAAPPPPSFGSSRAAVKETDARKRKVRKVAINGAVSLAGAAWLAVGLRRMTLEDNYTSSAWITKRLDACYASVWPYSMVR